MRRLILLMAVLAGCLTAWADRGGFHYTDIMVEAVVHENNVWEVKEVLTVDFTEPRHGIYRYIPWKFWLNHRVDGSEEPVRFNYISDIENVTVDHYAFNTETDDNGNLVIRIGDADREVTGLHTYVIHYTYTYHNDRRPNGDYLFHTILGTDFAEPIDHFSFRVQFDKPLPNDIADRLKVYSGEFGNEQNVIDLQMQVTPTVIEGQTDHVPPYHGLTLYAPLPEGYYTGVLSCNYLWHYLFLGITVFLILAIVVCLLLNRRPHVTKSIEFYPPEDISSAEVGTIIDSSVDIIDIASLIPWLAGKGYLKIKEVGKDDLQLTKVKDLPLQAPKYQRLMMQLFFKNTDVVLMKSLGEQPSAVSNIIKTLDGSFKGERKLSTLRWPAMFYLLLCIFATLTLGTNSVEATFYAPSIFLAVAFFGIPYALCLFFRLFRSNSDLLRGMLSRLIGIVVTAVIMAAFCATFCCFFIPYGAPMSAAMVAVMFAVCFLLGEFIGQFNVDTPYRTEMMGRLLGFKEFIETAEHGRLQGLQADDPHYFYTILPYAMVFGLSKKWSNLFKDIDVEKPDWYDARTPLLGYALTNHMVNSLCSSVSHAITTISHDSSSHGHGGGGFSGGGGGGGGGGSW